MSRMPCASIHFILFRVHVEACAPCPGSWSRLSNFKIYPLLFFTSQSSSRMPSWNSDAKMQEIASWRWVACLYERLRAPCVVAGRASEGGGHPGRPAAAAVGQGVDQGRRPRGRTEGDETRLQKRWRTVGTDSDNSAKFRFSNLWFGRAMDLSSDGKGCWIIAARVRWQWNERDRDCIGACMLYRPVACVL